jgi:hypothetical protein
MNRTTFRNVRIISQLLFPLQAFREQARGATETVAPLAAIYGEIQRRVLTYDEVAATGGQSTAL